jgi:hypothetical protein
MFCHFISYMKGTDVFEGQCNELNCKIVLQVVTY